MTRVSTSLAATSVAIAALWPAGDAHAQSAAPAPPTGNAVELAPIVVTSDTTPATPEDAARKTRRVILPKGAATSTTVDKTAIETMPAGQQTNFDRVLLRLPGVSQDASGSGDFHVRNEHANVQYRINGILLPDGVSGFSQVLDSTFVRSLTLLDGALPAQYGLHTAGVIDIETRTGDDAPGGAVSLYGGSHATISPTIEDAGTTGRWDYFVSGRFNANSLGIENPLRSHEAVHDDTRQGRYFAYLSGALEDGSRLTFLSGASTAAYQIPNTPGLPPAFTAYGATDFNSALLNETQIEQSIFNVIAWQKSIGALETQISYVQRYSTLHFVPDPIGDIVFNGVASDVRRTSLVNGVQSDSALRTSGQNMVRFGFTADIERAQALDTNTVLPIDAGGNPVDAPFAIADAERKTGFVGGVYTSDEYRLTPQIALTAGLRYDGMVQYTTADQLSPRLGLVYQPNDVTTLHAGYARTFTPPELALSAPTPVGLYTGTTLQPAQDLSDPVRPERADVFDIGVTHRLLPGLDVGLDGYYKIAKNLLDDGQFGQALVLTAFNYDHAYNDGVEFKANYVNGSFSAYGNLAVAQQRAKEVTSNQYLFDSDELAYIQNKYVFTDHDQLITMSAGASYKI